MKAISVFSLTAGLLMSTAAAIQLVQRDASPAVLGLDIERKGAVNPLIRDRLRRRQNTQTVTQTLDNEVRPCE